MKRVFVFSRVGVVIQSVYFSRPDKGDEHGVRLELRLIDEAPHRGTAAAAQGLSLDETVWRVDIFTSVPRLPMRFDRAHFHPSFQDHEPSEREWDEQLAHDPHTWLRSQLSDLGAMLARANRHLPDVVVADRDVLKQSIPEITERVEFLWREIDRSGMRPSQFDLHLQV